MVGIEKTLFVLSTELAKIDGTNYIPTALYYQDGTISFGHKAIKNMQNNCIVNVKFKIELGEYEAEKKYMKIELLKLMTGLKKQLLN